MKLTKKTGKATRDYLMMLGISLSMVLTGCAQQQPTEPEQSKQEQPVEQAKEEETKNEQPEQEEVAEESKDEQAVTYPITIMDSTNTEVVLEEAPERIVSLAPSTTEIIYFLGEEDKLVGRTEYCNFPESVQDVPTIGGTATPNVEAIIEAAPDLVLGATHTPEDVVAKLREVGIAVAFLNEDNSIEDTYQTIRLVGQLIDEQAEAEIVIEDMQERIDAVTEKLAGVTDKPSVYYATWYGDGDFTATGETFIGEIIRLAGAENIAEDGQGWSVSREVIAESDPDMFIVQAKDYMTLEEEIKQLQEMDFYKELTSVKEGAIYAVNADTISRPAPRLVEALEELATIIHPEIMKADE